MAKTNKVVAASKNARVSKTTKTAPNLAKVTNQAQFLETYLRGTGRKLSADQARANYGIANLSARMSEFRSAGLRVNTDVNTAGNTVYSVSARDIKGSRATRFA